MTKQPTNTIHHIKEKLHTFVEPFKPLGQAIIVFAKTNTGKTVGALVLIIIITGGIINHLEHRNHKERNHDTFHYPKVLMMMDSDEKMLSDPRGRHERQMKEFDRDFDRIHKRIAQHRQDMLEAMRMDSPSLSIDPTTTHQTISKFSIDNNKQSGYSLTISGGIIQGTLTGSNTLAIIDKLKSLKATASGSMFSLPYTIDNLQKVVEILNK